MPGLDRSSSGREILVKERDLQSRVRDPLQKQVSWVRPFSQAQPPFSSKSTITAMRRGDDPPAAPYGSPPGSSGRQKPRVGVRLSKRTGRARR